MRTRRSQTLFQQPSLVPLADMLTNTLGIVIFILIFVVLVSNVKLKRNLPIEHTTQAEPAIVYCYGGRVVPFTWKDVAPGLKVQLADQLKMGVVASDLDNREFRVNGMSLKLHFIDGSIMISCLPLPGTGETPAQAQQPNSKFRQFLKRFPSSKYFVDYAVYPDSIGAFRVARDISIESKYANGWDLWPADQPLEFGQGSGTYEGIIQG